ncbi:hypothetical protein J7E63_01160 [Bacillus sp. ISL-75]|nr:hypothetical protein [Bacillus sp. ISL-75]
MAKRPGVSATFHIIAVKDQHCLLYIKHKTNATLITIFFYASISNTFPIIAADKHFINYYYQSPEIS